MERRWSGTGRPAVTEDGAGQETTARTREKGSSGSHQCPKNKWCRSWRFSISAVPPASHSLTTGHCSRATGHSAFTGHFPSPLSPGWGTAPPAADWLRFRLAGSVEYDSTTSGNELCVDSGLASFCTFSRVFTPESMLCRSQSPWYGRSVASVPSCDKIPILLFVESSMTRSESYSHDRTLAPPRRHLAALPVTTPTRSHLASGIRHLPSVIRHPAFAIRLFCFPILHSKIRNPQFPKLFQRSDQLAVPGGLVAAVPLECRAAIHRRAVVLLVGLVCLDFLMLGQQLLEPADVPLDDRADEDQRRVLIAGRRGDLAIGHKLEAADIAQRQVISAVILELVADAVAQRIEGMEEGIEFRVEVRLDTALTQQPDEADDFRITPGGFAVQKVQYFGPASEHPAAAFGAFFEAAHDHRRVVIRGRTPSNPALSRPEKTACCRGREPS